ncbi:putative membrane protein [Aliarcobacter faecis]|uniref:hypothetical protein n=1 Tax=Aliarcobacter faecis TaxID=1564138 RepID=UPI00047B0303|nr:hypothetical protein [Aliarcobacter faecis]QKF73270.1 putative membrane protein [Aliarcobacter faecis]
MKNDDLKNYWEDDKKLNKAFKEIKTENEHLRLKEYEKIENYKFNVNLIIFFSSSLFTFLLFNIYKSDYHQFIYFNFIFFFLAVYRVVKDDYPDKFINIFLCLVPFLNIVIFFSKFENKIK